MKHASGIMCLEVAEKFDFAMAVRAKVRAAGQKYKGVSGTAEAVPFQNKRESEFFSKL